jgi:hypothetical protein
MTFVRIAIPFLAPPLSMIFSENRCTLFGIMLLFEHDLFRKPLHTFRDHALGSRHVRTGAGAG